SLAELSLCLSQLTFRLLKCGVKRARINLEKHFTTANNCSLSIVLFHQISGNLRLNLRIDVPIENCDPFTVDRDVLLNNTSSFHVGGYRCGWWFLCATSEQWQKEQHAQHEQSVFKTPGVPGDP